MRLILSLLLSLICIGSVWPQYSPYQPSRLPSYGFAARVAGKQLEDGTEVDCDYPDELQFPNAGGSDGSGLCVFNATTWAAQYAGHLYLGDPQKGLFTWMRSRPGGGYPSKLAAMIREFCTSQGITEPPYVQIEDDDLDKVERLVKGNHLVGVTYCRSPTGRYNGKRIAHMLVCVAARAGPRKLWAIIDNNYKGVEWMSEEDFRVSYTGFGGGWTVAFKRPGPPLPPRNMRRFNQFNQPSWQGGLHVDVKGYCWAQLPCLHDGRGLSHWTMWQGAQLYSGRRTLDIMDDRRQRQLRFDVDPSTAG